jgi:hypothetical protein
MYAALCSERALRFRPAQCIAARVATILHNTDSQHPHDRQGLPPVGPCGETRYRDYHLLTEEGGRLSFPSVDVVNFSLIFLPFPPGALWEPGDGRTQGASLEERNAECTMPCLGTWENKAVEACRRGCSRPVLWGPLWRHGKLPNGYLYRDADAFVLMHR